MREFEVGEAVYVRDGLTRGEYRADTIARTTETLYITASGKRFNRASLEGPKPKGRFGSPDSLVGSDDQRAVRASSFEAMRSAAVKAERLIARAETSLAEEIYASVEQLRDATEVWVQAQRVVA